MGAAARPPPPAPEVTVEPTPPPAPPPAPAPPARPAAAPAPPAPLAEERYGAIRFAPTLHLLLVGWNVSGVGEGWVPAPSLRTGLRFATFPRSTEPYSWNLGVSVELGLEGLGLVQQAGQLFGVGLTVKAGPTAVTRGGLFFPFLDAYALWSGTFVRNGFVNKLGVGLNFNLLALLSEGRAGPGGSWHFGSWSGGGGSAVVAALVLMSILMPNVELVFTPPSPSAPWSSFEVRLGAGF